MSKKSETAQGTAPACAPAPFLCAFHGRPASLFHAHLPIELDIMNLNIVSELSSKAEQGWTFRDSGSREFYCSVNTIQGINGMLKRKTNQDAFSLNVSDE